MRWIFRVRFGLFRIITAFLFLYPLLDISGRVSWRESYGRLEESALSGDGESLYRLSRLLSEGWDSIPVDSLRSLQLLKQSASAGFATAMNELGYLYHSGYTVSGDTVLSADPDSMIYWIRKSAESGDGRAMANMGFLLLEQSDSIVKNHGKTEEYRIMVSEGISYLNAAADAGATTAMSRLGDVYLTGLYMPADSMLAVKYYEQAAVRGLADAEVRLINMMGRKWESLNPDSAFSLAEKYRDYAPTAAVLLYENAARLPDLKQAVTISDIDSLRHGLNRAAEAMQRLGEAYSRGIGTGYDYAKSLAWYAKSALGGNREADTIMKETLSIFPDTMGKIADEIEDYIGQVKPLLIATGGETEGLDEFYKTIRNIKNK